MRKISYGIILFAVVVMLSGCQTVEVYKSTPKKETEKKPAPVVQEEVKKQQKTENEYIK